MKIKLESPPEGFEAEAEWKLPKRGDPIMRESGRVAYAACDYNHSYQIVLTPKKKMFWRLDPVATFEEATKSRQLLHVMGLAMDHGTDGATYWASDTCTDDVQWLRRTEHEDRT